MTTKATVGTIDLKPTGMAYARQLVMIAAESTNPVTSREAVAEIERVFGRAEQVGLLECRNAPDGGGISDIVKALAVFLLDKNIRAWLVENEPMAIRQAAEAWTKGPWNDLVEISENAKKEIAALAR